MSRRPHSPAQDLGSTGGYSSRDAPVRSASSRPHRQPTILDVAALAGVSIKTVSRVVNGEAYVAEATATRVRQAINELGFRRNDLAHLLRKQRAATIGLVIEDLGNPFYAMIARGAERVVHGHDSVLVVSSSEEDPERERALMTTLFRRRVDGLLLVPTSQDHSFLRPEVERGTAIVCLDRPAAGLDVDCVLLDNFRGAHDAVSYLVERGHRRVAIVSGGPGVWTGDERRRGYEVALREHGIDVDPGLIAEGCFEVAEADRDTRRLLSLADPPTAIFADNNRCAVGVLRAVAASAGDVEVVGFDDFDLASVVRPPITTVSHDPSEMGRRAAELLFERVAGSHEPPRQVVIPVRLAVRSRPPDPAGGHAT